MKDRKKKMNTAEELVELIRKDERLNFKQSLLQRVRGMKVMAVQGKNKIVHHLVSREDIEEILK